MSTERVTQQIGELRKLLVCDRILSGELAALTVSGGGEAFELSGEDLRAMASQLRLRVVSRLAALGVEVR